MKTALLAISLAVALTSSQAVCQASAIRSLADRPADAPHKGTRLILLGTSGGPIANSKRSQPAQLLVVDGRPYLIDAGDGTAARLRQAGFDAKDVGQIFLTHLHIDHTLGLAPVIAFNWISGDRQSLTIHGPPGTGDFVRSALSYLSIPAAIHGLVLPPHPDPSQLVKIDEIDTRAKRLVFSDDRLKVYAVANSHYVATPPARTTYGPNVSYSYRFETADRSFVFTGDTGPSQPLTDFAKGADVMVSEVIDLETVGRVLRQQFKGPEKLLEPLLVHMRDEHLTPPEIGKMASAAGVGMVVLSHIAPATEIEPDPLNYLSGVRQHYTGPVVFAHDLQEF